MKEKDIYQFNFNDIARYHSGEMSAAEMHVLENAALNDPMLMDAVDGYLKVAIDQNDIAELKSKILKVEKSSGSLFNKQLYYTLSLAASLLVVVFVGYQFLQKQKDDKVSIAGKIRKEKPTPIPEKPSEQNNVIVKDNSNTQVTKQEIQPRVKSVIKSNQEALTPEQNVAMADIQPVENSSNTTEQSTTDLTVATTAKEQQESETKSVNQTESLRFSPVQEDVKDEVNVKAVAVTRTQMNEKFNVDLPILTAVYHIIYGNRSARKTMHELAEKLS